MSEHGRPLLAAPRFMPLAGALTGALGGVTYWVAAQIWPTSIAVILSMFATAIVSAGPGTRLRGAIPLGFIFALLVKYNALMALSAASLPFPLPTNVALGVIVIAGHAASRALIVSILASPGNTPSRQISHADVALALIIGFAPAALIGVPGLIGLVAAIVGRIAFVGYIRRSRDPRSTEELDIARQLTEVCFYLGALAASAYI